MSTIRTPSSARPASFATDAIFAAGPTRIGTISFRRAASRAPASADASQGWATAVVAGARPLQSASSCSYLPEPVFIGNGFYPAAEKACLHPAAALGSFVRRAPMKANHSAPALVSPSWRRPVFEAQHGGGGGGGGSRVAAAGTAVGPGGGGGWHGGGAHGGATAGSVGAEGGGRRRGGRHPQGGPATTVAGATMGPLRRLPGRVLRATTGRTRHYGGHWPYYGRPSLLRP